MRKSIIRASLMSVAVLSAILPASFSRVTSPTVYADTVPGALPDQTTSTTTSGSYPDPSGQPMPVGDIAGWHQVFADDFTTNVSTGSFPGSVYGGRWSVYSNGAHDTSGNGEYYPSKVLSVSNGMLNMYLHTENGIHMVAAALPKLPTMTYGRYSVRFRADSLYGYKTAWLDWPNSGNQWADGEIDFPESCTGLDGIICAFLHRTYGSGRDAFNTSARYPSWHTATTEWSPGRVTFYLDGQAIGTTTSGVPTNPMHWVLQTETATWGESAPSSGTAGNVQVDWAVAYTWGGGSSSGSSAPIVKISGGSASPSTTYPNWTEHLGATVTSNQTISGALVSFEVYNSAGSKVYQTFSGPLTLSANSGQWVSAAGALPSNLPVGTYTVKVLVFGPNWNPLYASQWAAMSFYVA